MNYYAISHIPGYNFLGTSAITKKPLTNNNIRFQSNKTYDDPLARFGNYIPRVPAFTGDEIRGNKLNVLG